MCWKRRRERSSKWEEPSVAEKAKWDAGLYDDKHSFVWKLAAAVFDLLDAKPGERILDLGCGTGHLTAKIADTGAHVVGVDRSPEMIHQARLKYPSLRFEVMDAREIALDGNFDAVFSNATLHWIKEPERVIAGIKKSLCPGGRFVAEFGGKGNTSELLKALGRAWANLKLAGPAPHPWFYPSIAEYAGLLEQHGFEVTHAALFDRPTPLDDGERGLRNWLEMFGSAFVESLPKATRERLLVEIERELRPRLYRDGHWVMDYRRLRVAAKRL
jgi:trans-aconitate methyltransferase